MSLKEEIEKAMDADDAQAYGDYLPTNVRNLFERVRCDRCKHHDFGEGWGANLSAVVYCALFGALWPVDGFCHKWEEKNPG